MTNDPGRAGKVPRAATVAPSPFETLKLARITGTSIALVPLLLSYVTWILLTDESSPSAGTTSEIVPLLLVLLGAVVAIAAPRFAASLGRYTARRWAQSGLRGDQVAPTTRKRTWLEILARTQTSKQPVTLCSSLMLASVTGSALPEIAVLAGFVATGLTGRYLYMLFGVVIFFMVWWQSIPTRDKWDDWATSAGLAIPWEHQQTQPPMAGPV